MRQLLLFHFRLEFLRFRRSIEDLGFNFISIFLVLVLFFTGASYYAYLLDYSAALPLLGLLFLAVFYANKKSRVQFYRTIYGKRIYSRIKLTETGIPLVIAALISFLIVKNQGVIIIFGWIFLAILLLFIASFVSKSGSFILPTPFKKRPFEFIQGFRNSWFVFTIIGFILFKSIEFNNENLAAVSCGLTVLISAFYFNFSEPQYFLVIQTRTAKSFLFRKIVDNLLNSFWLTLPALVITVFYFPNIWWLMLLIVSIGWLYMINSVLSKYAFYPAEINISQTILLILCLMIPPVMVLTTPLLWHKAQHNLNRILT